VSERLDLESIAEIIGSYCPAHETGVDPRMIAEAVLDEILPEVERLRTELAKSEAFVEHFRQLHRDWKSAFEGAKAEADRLTVELARRDQQITALRQTAKQRYYATVGPELEAMIEQADGEVERKGGAS
jgi:hypothetical protein